MKFIGRNTGLLMGMKMCLRIGLSNGTTLVRLAVSPLQNCWYRNERLLKHAHTYVNHSHSNKSAMTRQLAVLTRN